MKLVVKMGSHAVQIVSVPLGAAFKGKMLDMTSIYLIASLCTSLTYLLICITLLLLHYLYIKGNLNVKNEADVGSNAVQRCLYSG